MDRPSRRTKAVNYCEAKDFDDDDDFAHARAPPSKKAREDGRQEPKKSLSKSSSQESNSQLAQSEKSRKPLDEKMCERDLEAAITLSLLNNSEGAKEAFPTSKGDAKVQIPIDENTDPTSLHLSNCSVNGAVLGLDRITADRESTANQRKSNTKAAEVKTKEDEDEDYRPKMTPDSESDEDFSEPGESEDEEFTIKKAHKKAKKEKTTKKDKTKPAPASKSEKQLPKPSKCKSQAADSTVVRSPPTAKPAPARPASSSSVSTWKTAASLSPAGGRIPKWNPPAQVGRSPSSQSPSVKSPGQGLRLGLSRLVRVKPLHPSLASH